MDVSELGITDSQKVIRRFLATFDGTPDAFYLQQAFDGSLEDEGWSHAKPSRRGLASIIPSLEAAPRSLLTSHLTPYEADTDDGPEGERLGALLDVRATLVEMLRRGLPGERPARDDWPDFDTLRFTLAPVGRDGGSRGRRRVWRTAEACCVTVNGALRDLLPYLLLRVLSSPGLVAVTRCPSPHPAGRRCDRLVVAGAGRGRPAEFCSDLCRVRAHRAKERIAQREVVGTLRAGRRRSRG